MMGISGSCNPDGSISVGLVTGEDEPAPATLVSHPTGGEKKKVQ